MPSMPASLRPWAVAVIALSTGLCAARSASQAYRARPVERGADSVVDSPLECRERGRSAPGARLVVTQIHAYRLDPPAGGEPVDDSSLYAVHFEWTWPTPDPDVGYGRVSLGLKAAGGTIVDLYPRTVGTALPVDAALGVDHEQRLRVVSRGPGTLPIEPWAPRVSGRMQGGWAYWSVAAREEEGVAPGAAPGYVLVHLPGSPSHLELHVRMRAHVGTWRFGLLRRHCVAETRERTLSLPLGARREPRSASRADAGTR